MLQDTNTRVRRTDQSVLAELLLSDCYLFSTTCQRETLGMVVAGRLGCVVAWRLIRWLGGEGEDCWEVRWKMVRECKMTLGLGNLLCGCVAVGKGQAGLVHQNGVSQGQRTRQRQDLRLCLKKCIRQWSENGMTKCKPRNLGATHRHNRESVNSTIHDAETDAHLLASAPCQRRAPSASRCNRHAP